MATYDNNPPFQFGTGAFGQVPGATGMPPNTYQQLQGAYAPFMQQLGSAGQNITSELAGNVDMPSISRNAAAFGIGSGMPGSGFQAARGLNMTIQAQQAMKRQGLQDYMGLSGMLGSMQTPQNTAIGLSESNANLGAAPNPQAVYQKMMDDYMRQRNQNPAGGTGTYAPPPIISGATGGSRASAPIDNGGNTGGSGPVRYGGANVGTEILSGTYYDPATDTSNNSYGMPQWNTGGSGGSGGTDLTQWLSNQGLDQWGDPMPDNSGSGGSPALGDMGFGNWYDSGGNY
jgi:hypothetical protein